MASSSILTVESGHASTKPCRYAAVPKAHDVRMAHGKWRCGMGDGKGWANHQIMSESS